MMNDEEPKEQFFYGWVIVACCFACCFSYGPFYTLGVFFTNLQDEFGWSSALTSSIHSIHMIVFIFSTFFMGWLSDRFGPRLPIMLGAIFFGVGFSLLSRVQNLVHFYLLYAFASIGVGIIFALPTATVQKWFVKKSGLALGIVVAGVGVGTLVYSPLARYLISVYGWRTAYIQIGAGTAILLFLASVGVTTPMKKGLKPYRNVLDIHPEGPHRIANESGWSLGEAFRSKTFWLISSLSFCAVIPIQIIAIHLVPFAESIGIQKTLAAWAWGLVGGLSILGRIIAPTFLESSIGWRRGLVVICAILTFGFLWISKATSLWMLYLFVVVYGFFYGGKVPLVPALIGSYFGTKYLGQLIGLVHAISLIGGAVGPLLAGYVVDVTGNYIIAFLLGAVFLAFATFFAWLSKPPR